MKLVVYLYLSMIVLGVQAWPSVKRSFEIFPNPAVPHNVHTVSDCMHVASEAGDYIFKKLNPLSSALNRETALLELEAAGAGAGAGAGTGAGLPGVVPGDRADVQEVASPEVCGLYVIGEPDTIVEITMKHYDANCETGALMAFVDGWELNGEYFPGIKDHHRPLEERVYEFCNNYRQWPRVSNKKFFRSSQNAALLQYRIPTRGSFVANVRFHKITQPCNVLVQDVAAMYKMTNFGQARNCTISALFPAVVSLASLRIGGKSVRAQQKVNYDCQIPSDRLEIGGSAGLDSLGMDQASAVCGASSEPGPEQAIFCGVSTVRLVSSGRYQNQAALVLRKADVQDLDIATLMCAL
ncbi:corticotropin-releasing factor-binding protein isoform X1 [Drosophila serrata]|uniref:corticotropin-releasing factor-binding protein isoform X1 n=1 Tax=Drosophila serrata TaxID=7274 RepID=UPI000A1D3951|nr:corticotropin-releasing factor-binding protein isoform X1 [Drosophila serrata]XP_020811226.1 corticotropin-releasing factor-binding protein isoform X1 [Drosophila serrata]